MSGKIAADGIMKIMCPCLKKKANKLMAELKIWSKTKFKSRKKKLDKLLQ